MSLPFDPDNPLLASTLSQLDTGVMRLTDGSRVAILTIRTASTTQTVLLSAGDLATWRESICGLERKMQGSVVAVPSLADIRALGVGSHQ